LDVTFEYILATLVIFIMLGASIYTVTTLTTNQIALITEQQITPTAQTLMDKILLTPGSASVNLTGQNTTVAGWGYNILVNSSTLKDFGLGLAEPNAALYEVDPFKLMKLVNGSSLINSLYIDPLTAGKLLGLYSNGRWNYGFRLQIVPSLNISISYSNSTLDTLTYPDNFNIQVQNSDGIPAQSASVQLNLFEFVATNGDNYTYALSSTSLVTNYLGNATYTFGSPPLAINSSQTANFLITASANYYGIVSDTVLQYPVVPKAFSAIQLGQYLVCNLTQAATFLHSAAHPTWTFTVIELTNNLNIIQHLAVNQTGVGVPELQLDFNHSLQTFALANQVTSDVIFSGMLAKYGAQYFFVGSTLPNLPVPVDYYSQSFATSLGSTLLLNSVTVQRYVHIASVDYSVYLTLWRMGT